MLSFPSAFEPVAITSRSGRDESVHHGMGVALDADGSVVATIGDPRVGIYSRSSNKPMQADAMLRAGWQATSRQVAIACASHSGTDHHVEVVEEVLAAAGATAAMLANTADLPIDHDASRRFVAAGGVPSSLRQNCSGKHAAMVATCLANGWDPSGYLDVDHPLQRTITGRIEELAGPVEHIGVDGCGAPAHVLTLSGLARAFGRLAAEQGPVCQAMTTHPELVGGEGRDVTRIMRLVPGLMAKDGAEGVFAAGLPDGRSAAVKIADGNGRAAGMLLAAMLQALGVDIDATQLGDPILGHGEPVGTIRLIEQPPT